MSAINTGDTCLKLKLEWNLTGFIFKPTMNYVAIKPKVVKRVGYLVDEVVTYANFTYALKGYGKVRKLITKECEEKRG